MDTYARQIVVNAHQRDRQAEAREVRLASIATTGHESPTPRVPVVVMRGHLRPLALGFLLSFGVLVGAVAANSDAPGTGAPLAAAEQSGSSTGGSGGGGPAAAQPQ